MTARDREAQQRRDMLLRLSRAHALAAEAVGALTRAHSDVVLALGVEHAASTAAHAAMRAAERAWAQVEIALKRAP